ncbi:MAG: aspartate kinase [Flavobacteriaceae bacterium]|nr:aspartate kinase [Flavobacteriaceae bacterium]
MKVLKFGGASVKDAKGVRNLKKVLETIGCDHTVLVISAMGKMTNAFEKIVDSYYYKKEDLQQNIEAVRAFHEQIINDLFPENYRDVLSDIQVFIDEINDFIQKNNSTDYDFIYDQIVSKAELISTKICSTFLNEHKLQNDWLDIRKCIKTNSVFRRARIDWEKTNEQVNTNIDKTKLTITQGFIASDDYGKTTTLGREGSDYTAAIIAHCLGAEEVSVFKDVAGLLNADPREFDATTLLNQVSYKEAIEMAFFGASVIHPKTLQPLQRKEIPLYVKSFIDPLARGTSVSKGVDLDPKIPCFIIKKNQILLSVSDKEFHFVMEDDISEIFDYLHQFKMKVNLIQNSAISFSVCIEDNFNNFEALFQKLHEKYKVLYNKDLTLYTVRHFTEDVVAEIEKNKEILIKQLSRETVQIVVKN